jgi:CHASE2 domain-containing sensor protein
VTPASPGIRRPSRAATEWWLLTALLLALVAVLTVSSQEPSGHPIGRLDATLYDLGMRVWARAPRDDVVVVAIDDDSLAQIGRWPWRRAVGALLLERIQAQSPRVIGIDVLFVESADGDEGLAVAAAAGPAPLVLPIARLGGQQDDDLPLLPIPRLGAGRALGHAEFAADADGLVRGLYLYEGGFPAMSLLLTRPDPPVQATTRTLAAAIQADRWERTDRVGLGALQAPPPQISAAALIRGDIPPDTLRDRIVLVGATARGLGDRHPTVLYTDTTLVAGVDMHAAAVNAILSGRLLRTVPPSARIAIFWTMLLILLGALYLTPPRGGLLLTATAIGATGGASVAAIGAGWWLAPGALLAGLALAFPLWSWRRLHAASVGLMAQAARLEADDPSPAGGGSSQRFLEPIAQRLHRLENAGDRIRELNHHLGDTLESLRAAQREREQTLRFLSHDLRSPHLAILSLLESRTDGALGAEDAQRIERHSRRALELTDGFMQLARAESQPLRLSPHDLLDLITEAADACWQRSTQRGLRIETPAPDRAPTPPVCLCDAQLLRRALVNLLDNALRFGPPGSTVDIGLDRIGSFWRLTVCDRGPGIDPADRGRIFEPWWRGTQPDAGGGAGLGLAFVAAVMERHRGRATASGRDGGGAQIEIWLPDDPDAHLALH